MKVWEETWDECDGVVSIEQKHERDFALAGIELPDRFDWEQGSNVGAFGDMGGASPFNPSADDVARARLAAAAPEMARVLLSLEWRAADERALMCCESCGGVREVDGGKGHVADCALVAVLRKAGVR